MSDLPLFVLNSHCIKSGDMSGNLASNPIDIAEVSGYAAHFVWTGSPAGNISIQGSNDGINFKNVDTFSITGAAGQYMFNEPGVHYRYVKAIFTFGSGTGSLDCYISGKRS